MPETPETHEHVVKMQKDIEELRYEMEDTWHLNKEKYQKMVEDALQKDSNCVILYLEIDGFRSMKEIEDSIASSGKVISQPTLWRASKRLERDGLIRKIGTKSRSPIFTKKRWALALHLDDYVKKEILKQEN